MSDDRRGPGCDAARDALLERLWPEIERWREVPEDARRAVLDEADYSARAAEQHAVECHEEGVDGAAFEAEAAAWRAAAALLRAAGEVNTPREQVAGGDGNR